ncbi:MAG: EAL domain-containing protein (putative c-di-GMP-specific phosphodiesterase class I) [Granulosicoccus sp.]|jgi:EAL domain-containing protein (putative c-di-GMP-specific phosphodiesterase class I)/GGDEF domain-containing protein
MIKTLRFHIGLLLASLLLATTMLVLIVVWFSTDQFAKVQVEKELTVGVNVLERILSNREELLVNASEVLTADFGFRQAVASADKATIKSVLSNHRDRIGADFMATLNLQGVAEVAVGADIQQDYLNNITEQVLSDGGIITVAPIHNRLYQLVLVTVDTPTPIAIAVIGFELDEALAKELKQITGLDVSFVWGSPDRNNQKNRESISTLGNINAVELVHTIENSSWRLPFTYPQDIQSSDYPLNENHSALVYLSINLHKVFSEYDHLQLNISLVSAFAIPIALLVALIFSKNLTRPLQKLVVTAKAISSGNYSNPTEIYTGVETRVQEVNDLAITIEKMQINIRRREEEIKYRATHDVTTGLLNRASFIDKIQLHISEHKDFQIIGFGINNIRQINNMFGPAIGQLCLEKIGHYLSNIFVCVARSSDERFMAMIDYELSVEDIQNIHTLLKAKLFQSLEKDHVHINTEIFIGTIPFDSEDTDLDSIIRKLDITMDASCTTNKEVCLYQTGHEAAYLERLQIVEDLRLSISNNGSGLAMFYQPKLDLETGTVSKMEALIRWNHSERGFIPPDVFIPLAEQSGLINSLTEWIIETVVTQVSKWIQEGYHFEVAINLSAQDIARAEMLTIINKLLLTYNVPSESLSFEITESEIMSKPEEAIQLLGLFRERSFKLAIDDFGTGYSSLAQLKNMPVTELKIDREFVMHLAENPDDQIIVHSTIDLANSFNLGVIAEGVEDVESLNLLAKLGCKWAQGYFIARPMAGAAIVEWLQQFHDKKTYSGYQKK